MPSTREYIRIGSTGFLAGPDHSTWRCSVLSQLSCAGVDLLQPSSALAGAALFALLYSALARAWSQRRPTVRHIFNIQRVGLSDYMY